MMRGAEVATAAAARGARHAGSSNSRGSAGHSTPGILAACGTFIHTRLPHIARNARHTKVTRDTAASELKQSSR